MNAFRIIYKDGLVDRIEYTLDGVNYKKKPLEFLCDLVNDIDNSYRAYKNNEDESYDYPFMKPSLCVKSSADLLGITTDDYYKKNYFGLNSLSYSFNPEHLIPEEWYSTKKAKLFAEKLKKEIFFDEALFGKLDRLIESKSDLFKMAFKTDDLSYEVTEDRVTFAWFPWTGETDEGLAYSTFIDLLTKHIKEQKRVNASKTQTDNPKFAMRVFLIRLGMVGETYKTCRKILLRNLEGSSAFRKGAPHNEDTE